MSEREEFEEWFENSEDAYHDGSPLMAWIAGLAPLLKRIEELDKQKNNYKNIAQYLYKLLDDIDTATDMAKSDDAFYRKVVEHLQSKKSEVVMHCDGYTVEFVPNFEWSEK